MSVENKRQYSLKEIATDLREIDLTVLDVVKDKPIIMEKLQLINSKLGEILKGYPK